MERECKGGMVLHVYVSIRFSPYFILVWGVGNDDENASARCEWSVVT